jgi:ornithine carbamoyltransferase
VATPKGYEPKQHVVAAASRLGKISLTNDPMEAVDGAHVVYTDVWASMGHESEKDTRLQTFPPYRVDEALMSKGRPDAIFMHCLPAKRGEETTDAVMESARSVVFDQAENRLHAQKGLLLTLLG